MSGVAGSATAGGWTRIDAVAARKRLAGCTIAVPASSANLGPGFDTLAVALRLYLRVRVCDVRDDGSNTLACDFCGTSLAGDNFIERSFRTIAESEGVDCPTIAIEVRTEIPVQGGLGSSAAATVAGLLLYERLVGAREERDLLTLATRLDEHADNVAAALLGGLVTTCVRDDGSVIGHAKPWPERIRFVVASPAVQLATSDSRRVLPDAISREDAVFNLQRALLLVQALAHGTDTQIAEALRDRWHQPFRAPLVPGFPEVIAIRHPHLLGICLSGSGPSVLALCTGADEEIVRLLQGVYERIGVSCTVRPVTAHQPGLME